MVSSFYAGDEIKQVAATKRLREIFAVKAKDFEAIYHLTLSEIERVVAGEKAVLFTKQLSGSD